jgi:hypothetical protein
MSLNLIKTLTRLMLENDQNDQPNFSELDDKISLDDYLSSMGDFLHEKMSEKITAIKEKISSNGLEEFLTDEILNKISQAHESKRFLLHLKNKATAYQMIGFIYFEEETKAKWKNGRGLTKRDLYIAKEDIRSDVNIADVIIDSLIERIEEDSTAGEEEAPANAPLGKFAFSPMRPEVPLEKNTAVENELQAAIERHVSQNKKLSAGHARLLRTFIHNNWYSALFTEPEASVVFRGMSVSEKYLKNILGPDYGEIPVRGKEYVDWVFEPRESTSSWTTSKELAGDFTVGEDYYGVTLIAMVHDNPDKFVDMRHLYSLKFLRGWEHEKEIIGVGSIKIIAVQWISA